MAAGSVSGLKIWLLVIACLIGISSAQLYNNNFYRKKCPGVLRTVKKVVENAVSKERRMAGSLLRLHFHDCFVQASDLISRLSSVSFMSKSWSPKVNIFHPTSGLNTSTSVDQVLLIKDTRGCDASVLLDDTLTFNGEKNSFPNANSLRGFEVIDKIKSELESTCPGVVSCADIVAVAARDAIVAIGGPRWNVPLGRRDSTTASLDESNSDLPAPFLDRDGLVSAFAKKNFSQEEMVTLSGAHTIGLVRCTFFRGRIYNETNIDPAFAASMQEVCPFEGGDDNLSPFDITTPFVFDNVFYQNLKKQKGLVHSDQELFVDGSGPTDSQVQTYSRNPRRFKRDFADAMFKMTLLSPLTGNDGEIRTNCRFINAPDSTTTP